MSNQLLNTREAAQLLGVSMAFLERDRWAGARIPFIKIGTLGARNNGGVMRRPSREPRWSTR